MSDSKIQVAINAAAIRLLRPLCRLLLRHHVSFSAFAELAKHVYVQVALEDFAIPGRKPTLSRASVLTGLTRKEVQRLAAEPSPEQSAAEESFNRAARVLAGWANDARFRDPASGKPAALPLQDGDGSFAALVRAYSGDMPTRAMLDELVRVGAVRQRDDQQVELVGRAYVPTESEIEKLAILGNDVADLITTIDHNLVHGRSDPRFQRKVMYRNMPADVGPAFRDVSGAQAQALLERLDEWLVQHFRADEPGQPELPRVRVGMGIYYFEEPARPAHPPGE